MTKTSRYRKGLTSLKNRVTTNQKHTVDSLKPKRREHKHNVKGNHQTTREKKKEKEKERSKEEIHNQLENNV